MIQTPTQFTPSEYNSLIPRASRGSTIREKASAGEKSRTSAISVTIIAPWSSHVIMPK